MAWTSFLWRKRWHIGLAAAVLAGIVFRLLWLSDMEYKADEALMFADAEAFWTAHQWSWIGIPSSQSLPNGGLSVWQFVAIAAFVPADPLSVTRGVEIINVVALLMLAFFIARVVPAREREPWAWSLALIAVNPFAVLFSRKIWEQDLLPPYTMLMLTGWWYRGRAWGAFLWGLTGVLLGQVHLGGIFFAAAFFAVTLTYDRQTVRWGWWFAGCALGALPLVPYGYAVLHHSAAVGGGSLVNFNPLYALDWFGYASGLRLDYSLGESFIPFLASPMIFGRPSYLTLFVLIVIAVLLAILLTRFTVALRRAPRQTAGRLFAPGSNTALALLAGFPLYGLLLILTLRPMYMHYLVIDFCLIPLSLLWLDRAGGVPSRRLFAAMTVAQAALTFLFLFYIHVTPVIHGDYGTPYRAQSHNSQRLP